MQQLGLRGKRGFDPEKGLGKAAKDEKMIAKLAGLQVVFAPFEF